MAVVVAEVPLASPTTAESIVAGASRPPRIVRHGQGDGVIFLNVGGQEFTTLRSTVRINPVLWRHVSNAEKNNEFTKGGAVFIDRESSQFGPILQHLRNRAENLSGPNNRGWKKKLATTKKKKKESLPSVTISIPKDQVARNALFMEARYFRIKEIENTLCVIDFYTRFATFIGGGEQNPFVAASAFFTNARRFLLATVSGTGLFMGAMNDNTRKDATRALEDLRERLVLGKPSEATAVATPKPE